MGMTWVEKNFQEHAQEIIINRKRFYVGRRPSKYITVGTITQRSSDNSKKMGMTWVQKLPGICTGN